MEAQFRKNLNDGTKIFSPGHVVQVGEHGQLSAKISNFVNIVSNLLATNSKCIIKILKLKIASNIVRTKIM